MEAQVFPNIKLHAVDLREETGNSSVIVARIGNGGHPVFSFSRPKEPSALTIGGLRGPDWVAFEGKHKSTVVDLGR